MPLRELLTRIEKFKGDKIDYIRTIVALTKNLKHLP